MPKARRELQLNIRVSRDDRDRLEWLAKHFGISVADVVRMTIMERYRELRSKEGK